VFSSTFRAKIYFALICFAKGFSRYPGMNMYETRIRARLHFALRGFQDEWKQEVD